MPRATALEEVVGRADAHQVARPVGRQQRRDRLDHVEHHRLRLADREPADGIAVKADRRERVGAERCAQVAVVAALHDAEQRAGPRLLAEGALAALGPGEREAHGALELGARRGSADALVELHLRCRSRAAHWISIGALGRQRYAWSRRCASWKATPSSSSLRSCGERHHLEAAGIGEDRTRPAHEFVQAAERGDRAPRPAAASGDRCCRARCRRRPPRTSRQCSAFTVAAVPTGMKAGVRIAPRGVAITPLRAAPSVAAMRKRSGASWLRRPCRE